MHEGGAGVGEADSGQGAALLWVEEASRSSDGGQSDRHHPFDSLRDSFEEDNDAKGGRGIIGGLAGLIQDYPVGSFKGGRVVSKYHQGGEEFEYYRRIDKIDIFPHSLGDPIRARGHGRGGLRRGRV